MVMKDWKEYINKRYWRDEELKKDLEACGIPKRINFQDEIETVQEKYPIFNDKAGDWIHGGKLWVGSSKKANKIVGEEIFEPDMIVTSFIGNVVLDYLLKDQEEKL